MVGSALPRRGASENPAGLLMRLPAGLEASGEAASLDELLDY
jgi:hypothetical protein